MDVKEFSKEVNNASESFLNLNKSYCKVLDRATDLCKNLRVVASDEYASKEGFVSRRIGLDTYKLFYKTAFSITEAGTTMVHLGTMQALKWENAQGYLKFVRGKFSFFNEELPERVSKISGKTEELSRILKAGDKNAEKIEKELIKSLNDLLDKLENLTEEMNRVSRELEEK